MKNVFIISLMSAAVIGSCGHAGGTGAVSVISDSFKNGGYISKEYSCEGDDISPDIRWNYNGNAESFAVICEDPDAPGGTFIHWVVYNIPAGTKQLAKGFPRTSVKDGIYQGITDFDSTGYNGPCPPKGKPHRYIFTVYALNTSIKQSGLNGRSLKNLMKGRILGSGSITGLFKM